MNLRAALEDALNQSTDENRKTSFGRDKRSKVDVAAEAADVALEKLREISQQNVELDGKVRGAELMLERAERLVREVSEEVRREAEEIRNEMRLERQRISDEFRTNHELLDSIRSERAAAQGSLYSLKSEVQSTVGQLREEARQHRNKLLEEINDIRSNADRIKSGDSAGGDPGSQSGSRSNRQFDPDAEGRQVRR